MLCDKGGGQCICKNMVNYLVRGVEGMGMTFSHTYSLSNRFPLACQTVSKVPTYVHQGGKVRRPQ